MSYVDGDTTHSPIKATSPELFETLQYLVAKIPTIRINIQSILGPGFFIYFSFDFSDFLRKGEVRGLRLRLYGYYSIVA